MGSIFLPAPEHANSTMIWTWTLLAVRWPCSPLNHHTAAYTSISAHKSFEVALRQRMCWAVKEKMAKLKWTLNPGGADLPFLCAETLAEPGTVLPTHKTEGDFFFFFLTRPSYRLSALGNKSQFASGIATLRYVSQGLQECRPRAWTPVSGISDISGPWCASYRVVWKVKDTESFRINNTSSLKSFCCVSNIC